MLAIKCHGLTKRYRPNTTWGDWIRWRFERDEVIALDGVDLAIEPGQLVGLAGPNGAGKSTLLRTIAGLLTPNSGIAEVSGQAVVGGPSMATVVGYAISDERSHFWRLSGQENLRFFATLHDFQGSARDERIAEVARIVDLEEPLKRPVREYSTGMRQRLSLARALLGDPQVLLLDEPTRGLDPGGADRFRDFVSEALVARMGKTVLYATHQVDEMKHFCPRVILLNKGRVVADGPFDLLGDTFDSVFAPKREGDHD